jgi:PEP-CTERM motif
MKTRMSKLEIRNLPLGTSQRLPKACLPLFAASAIAFSAGGAQAALLAPFVESFSGGGGGSANTAVYTLVSSTSFSSFTLQDGVADGSFFDAASDGYASLRRTAAANTSNVIRGAYGLVELGDVGKIVSINAGFRHDNGMEAVWSIQLDGANVGGLNTQGYLEVASFTGDDIANDTNIRLSSVPSIDSDTLRTPGPLTYTIQAGDVGKALGLRVSVFENSSGAGTRTLLIDSISYDVIPEPTTALLAALGMLGLLRRRR